MRSKPSACKGSHLVLVSSNLCVGVSCNTSPSPVLNPLKVQELMKDLMNDGKCDDIDRRWDGNRSVTLKTACEVTLLTKSSEAASNPDSLYDGLCRAREDTRW